MKENITHKWIPRMDSQEKNVFIEEYYSSTDTQIKMDDEEQTEIGYINYSVQEQLKPLYGYYSRTFDDVAIGNRIVTGMFKVPIKNPEQQTKINEYIKIKNENKIKNFNEKQEKEKNKTEWIKNNITKNKANKKEKINDIDISYVSGLLDQLGYKYDKNKEKKYSIKNQVLKYQKDRNKKLDGTLTKKLIKEIEKEWIFNLKKSHNIKNGTKLYNGPNDSKNKVIKILDKKEKVKIIEKIKGWTIIELNDGTRGFIKDKNFLDT